MITVRLRTDEADFAYACADRASAWRLWWLWHTSTCGQGSVEVREVDGARLDPRKGATLPPMLDAAGRPCEPPKWLVTFVGTDSPRRARRIVEAEDEADVLTHFCSGPPSNWRIERSG